MAKKQGPAPVFSSQELVLVYHDDQTGEVRTLPQLLRVILTVGPFLRPWHYRTAQAKIKGDQHPRDLE